jgi:hypothetical protein
MIRRRRYWLIAALLYAVTWAGGWYFHVREISSEASSRFVAAKMLNDRLFHSLPHEGEATIRLRSGGPYSRVRWCMPLIPGFLLAESDYVVGPIYGEGGVKLILFYGMGTETLFNFWGWKS